MCQDIFDPDVDEEDSPIQDTEEPADQAFLLMSASTPTPALECHPRTLLFHGQIQGKPITILLDSGSTNSLDSTFAASLEGIQSLASPTTVKVADGSSVACSSQL